MGFGVGPVDQVGYCAACAKKQGGRERNQSGLLKCYLLHLDMSLLLLALFLFYTTVPTPCNNTIVAATSLSLLDRCHYRWPDMGWPDMGRKRVFNWSLKSNLRMVSIRVTKEESFDSQDGRNGSSETMRRNREQSANEVCPESPRYAQREASEPYKDGRVQSWMSASTMVGKRVKKGKETVVHGKKRP